MVNCITCKKPITHKLGKYVLSNGVTNLEIDVCSEFCAEQQLSKLY